MGLQKMAVKEGFALICEHYGWNMDRVKYLIKRFTGEEGKKLDKDYKEFREMADKLAQELDIT